VPRALLARHPFPGPGLGVRLLCSTGEEDRAHFDELEPALAATAARLGLDAVALPIRSVGVKADLRAWEHPVLVFGDAPWSERLRAAAAIYQEVPHVNRCAVWLGADRAPRPTRFQPRAATVTRARLDRLRDADAIVHAGLVRHGLHDRIWQCPTVAVPMSIDGRGEELIVVRPVRSERGMTAQPAELPAALLAELRDALLALPGVAGLALDVSTKPPGTIEWE
jgi:GMP synthase (glutamine-hydrolysing)